MNTNSRTALILGITGGIGGEVARVLLARGWRVRALHRRPGEVAGATGLGDEVEWIRGDAMCRDDVTRAAAGASVIVHAVNPPKYHNWAGLVLPMLENTIAAAKAQGARVLFPGTIYNFGPDAFPRLSEASPQNPLTPKGRIRVRMEERLRAAAGEGIRVLIVRAGDYFGPRAGNTWFSQGLLANQRKVRCVFYPGPRQLGHTWAYLPDLAETMARLLEQDARLADFEVFHFRGHWLARGADMADAVCRAAGISTRRIHAFPWWCVRLAAPFVEVFRETLEMRYLWNTPAELDNSKLRGVIGPEPHTPFDEAVARSHDWSTGNSKPDAMIEIRMKTVGQHD
jgi:nucleoside-diphosphate-sugar epimerase